MATPRFAWGIDVGNRALKAIRLSPGPDGLRIDDFDVVEHEQVLSQAGDNRESMIQTALANFVQRHDMRGGVVSVGVSGQASFARFIKLPPVEPRKIPEIVGFEAKQQIPFDLNEVEWSYQLFQDPNSPEVEVGIFAMRKDLVSQHIKMFTDVGLNVQVVQMNPLAVYNAMYHDDRLKGTTMIIDLGAENTDLIIADGEGIWLRSISIGGNAFTETLVKAFKLKFPKAEELKRNASTSKYGRQILQAMKPVFNDLVAEIQRSIGFYASQHRDARIARVLALGGTFRLPGLQKYVQQNLQIDVQRIDRLGAGAPADARAATQFHENILSSVSAYGLAIQAMEGAKINSSLLPASIRREKMWAEKSKWFAAAAAIFVAAPLIAYGSVEWGRRTLDANNALNNDNKHQLAEFTDYDQKWTQVEQAGSGDRVRTTNYNSLQLGRDIQAALLADITKCVPQTPPELVTALKSFNPGSTNTLPPRNQRQIIRIDSISMVYKAELGDMLLPNPETALKNADVPSIALKSGNGSTRRNTPPPPARPLPAMPGAPVAGAPATPKHGYIVEIKCTTPRSDGPTFVLNNFVTKLQGLKSTTPNVSYVFERVVEPYFGPLSENKAPAAPRMQNPMGMGRLPGALGGVPAPMPIPGRAPDPGLRGAAAQPGVPNAVPAFDPMQDPVTHEDMSKDIRVTIKMVVVLDPAAVPAPNP